MKLFKKRQLEFFELLDSVDENKNKSVKEMK